MLLKMEEEGLSIHDRRRLEKGTLLLHKASIGLMDNGVSMRLPSGCGRKHIGFEKFFSIA